MLMHDWRIILAVILVAAVTVALRLVERRRELQDRMAWMAELEARQQDRAERREQRDRAQSPSPSLREWLEESGLSDRLTVGSDGQLHAIRGEW